MTPIFFVVELGGMDTHDLYRLVCKGFVNVGKIRKHVHAVNTAVRPKIEKNHFASQISA